MDIEELRKAAERMRRWDAGERPSTIYTQGSDVIGAADNDAWDLARWAVAELSRRDAEQAERAKPIDEEWWSTNAGELGIWVHCDQCDYQIEPKFCGPGVCLSTWQHGASVAEVYLPNIATRGQLLDLLAALKGGVSVADIHQVQVWIDRDYEDGMKALRRLIETVAPQVEPVDTLQGLVSQIDDYISAFLRGDKWTIDKWREEYASLRNQNDNHVAELNRRGTALQRIAMLGDTMSAVHHRAFDTGPGTPIVNGWRVAEKMREVANDVIGSDPICDSCGGEGQVQLIDEGGHRMWFACPTCRPMRMGGDVSDV